MRAYDVREVARLLNINEETVRRWIRTGMLKATISSKKEGFIIDEIDLFEFACSKPKYGRLLGLIETKTDDTYRDELQLKLSKLIIKRDELNDRIYAIQTLLGEL